MKPEIFLNRKTKNSLEITEC